MRILVTGGKGSFGRRLVPRLADHEVIVGTRSPAGAGERHFDFAGERFDLSGVDCVVHLATDPLRAKVETVGSRRLFAQAAEDDVAHVVYVSIVGIDDHPYPYYRTKLAGEQDLAASGTPCTVVRATQFHSLIPFLVDSIRSPVLPVPRGVRLQPIDPDLVADRVAEVAVGPPSGRVDDMGGPEVLLMEDMVRAYLAARQLRRLVVPAPVWGEAVAAFRRGAVLTDQVVAGGRTYAEFLADEVQR